MPIIEEASQQSQGFRETTRWRTRARSHYENILELLKQRAESGQGVRASELYRDPQRYGRSPRNRISEANQRRWNVGSKPYGEGGDWFYWLRSDDSGKEYPTRRFEPHMESVYMRRERKEQEQAAPLFAGAQS